MFYYAHAHPLIDRAPCNDTTSLTTCTTHTWHNYKFQLVQIGSYILSSHEIWYIACSGMSLALYKCLHDSNIKLWCNYINIPYNNYIHDCTPLLYCNTVDMVMSSPVIISSIDQSFWWPIGHFLWLLLSTGINLYMIIIIIKIIIIIIIIYNYYI